MPTVRKFDDKEGEWMMNETKKNRHKKQFIVNITSLYNLFPHPTGGQNNPSRTGKGPLRKPKTLKRTTSKMDVFH
jgi:hypothetical protein